MRTYTEEEIRKAVAFGLWEFYDFDRTSNYDEESREEGLKEIQDRFVEMLNKE
jgi:hypothetical protein